MIFEDQRWSSPTILQTLPLGHSVWLLGRDKDGFGDSENHTGRNFKDWRRTSPRGLLKVMKARNTSPYPPLTLVPLTVPRLCRERTQSLLDHIFEG